MRFSFRGLENVLFELRSERVKILVRRTKVWAVDWVNARVETDDVVVDCSDGQYQVPV